MADQTKELEGELTQDLPAYRGKGFRRVVPQCMEAIFGTKREPRFDPVTGKRIARTPVEHKADLVVISEMLLMGWTQYQIAHHLGLSRPTVAKDILKIVDIWQEHITSNIDRLRGVEVAKMVHMESRAWEAFFRSCEDEITETEEDIESDVEGIPGRTRKSKKRRKQAGDPRFMEIAIRAAERRAKLLGLDAPKKHSIDLKAVTVNYEVLPDEALEELVRASNKAAALAAAGHQQPAGQLGFSPLGASETLLPAGQPLSADCATVAASGHQRPGGSEVVRAEGGETLDAEWSEVREDGLSTGDSA